MTGIDFIIKALEIVGIPQEYFYSISVQPKSGIVYLQGEYKSSHVVTLMKRGFITSVSQSGYTVVDVEKTSKSPSIRVTLT